VFLRYPIFPSFEVQIFMGNHFIHERTLMPKEPRFVNNIVIAKTVTFTFRLFIFPD
jgi:hypothetical protein